MSAPRPFRASTAIGWGLALLLAACAAPPVPAPAPIAAKAPAGLAALPAPAGANTDLARYHWLNRLTWGASSTALATHSPLAVCRQSKGGSSSGCTWRAGPEAA
jgi:hypothetical protein